MHIILYKRVQRDALPWPLIDKASLLPTEFLSIKLVEQIE